MKRLVEFPLDDDNSIVVEIEDPEPEGGLVKAARAGEIITKAQISFDQALEKVKPAASAIIHKLRSLHDAPDEIEVEFGLKLSAEFGAVVASTNIDANYNVTLKWKREENIEPS